MGCCCCKGGCCPGFCCQPCSQQDNENQQGKGKSYENPADQPGTGGCDNLAVDPLAMTEDETSLSQTNEANTVKVELENLVKEVKNTINEATEFRDGLKAEIEKAKEVHEELKADIERAIQEYGDVKRKHEEFFKQKCICVVSSNKDRAEYVSRAVSNLIHDLKLRVKIKVKEFEGRDIKDDIFEEARMAILVGFPQGRNMLLANPSENQSQLGYIYKKAEEQKLEIFVIYTDKEKPEDSELYHSSLKELFKKQKEVDKLAKRERFISLKFDENQQDTNFNKTQCELLSKWIENCSDNTKQS